MYPFNNASWWSCVVFGLVWLILGEYDTSSSFIVGALVIGSLGDDHG